MPPILHECGNLWVTKKMMAARMQGLIPPAWLHTMAMPASRSMLLISPCPNAEAQLTLFIRICKLCGGVVGRIMRFSCTKLFLFLSMFFYSFIAQVVVDGLAGAVVTKPELRVGFLGLVAITQTERERDNSENNNLND